MSLKTMDYVIKENYLDNVDKRSTILKFSKDLAEYFTLKNKYNEFLLKAHPTKKIVTTINNSHDSSKFITNNFTQIFVVNYDIWNLIYQFICIVNNKNINTL